MKLIQTNEKIKEDSKEFGKTFERDEILDIYFIIKKMCNILIII
jgi:hypothetical protein